MLDPEGGGGVTEHEPSSDGTDPCGCHGCILAIKGFKWGTRGASGNWHYEGHNAGRMGVSMMGWGGGGGGGGMEAPDRQTSEPLVRESNLA